MPRFMTGQECADACITLANFFDQRREFTCDKFLIQRPIDASDLTIDVDVGHYDPDWADRGQRVDQTYPGGIACRFLTARVPLDESRPRASLALWALGRVAATLEVDIVEACGYMVDSTLSTAPQLKLCCAADSKSTAKITTFLDSRNHFRDDQGMPHIITEYQNHNNKPIAVQLNFYPAI